MSIGGLDAQVLVVTFWLIMFLIGWRYQIYRRKRAASVPGELSWVTRAKRNSAARLSWLSPPPEGMRWLVHQTRVYEYRIFLANDAGEGHSRTVPAYATRADLGIIGAQMLAEFPVLKRKYLTADEFVARERGEHLKVVR